MVEESAEAVQQMTTLQSSVNDFEKVSAEFAGLRVSANASLGKCFIYAMNGSR